RLGHGGGIARKQSLGARSLRHRSRLRRHVRRRHRNGIPERTRGPRGALRRQRHAIVGAESATRRDGPFRGAAGARNDGAKRRDAVSAQAAPISDLRASHSRDVLRKHVGAAIALAVFVALFDALWNFGFWYAEPIAGLELFGHNLIIAPSFALSILAAALVAERATARGVHYAIAWSVAVAAGCV